jgi:hypothetical protein
MLGPEHEAAASTCIRPCLLQLDRHRGRPALLQLDRHRGRPALLYLDRYRGPLHTRILSIDVLIMCSAAGKEAAVLVMSAEMSRAHTELYCVSLPCAMTSASKLRHCVTFHHPYGVYFMVYPQGLLRPVISIVEPTHRVILAAFIINFSQYDTCFHHQAPLY